MSASIVELLRRDHERAHALFAEIEQITDVKEGSFAFDRLAKLLIAHSAAEKQAFYPVLEGATVEDEVEAAYDAHAQVELLVEQLLELNFDAPEFKQKFDLLRRSFLAHAAEEEEKLFYAAGQQLSPEALVALGAQTQDIKDETMDQVAAQNY